MGKIERLLQRVGIEQCGKVTIADKDIDPACMALFPGRLTFAVRGCAQLTKSITSTVAVRIVIWTFIISYG